MTLIQTVPPAFDDGTVTASAWNTRRLYTTAGQRIAAAYLIDQDLVVFVDIDRRITGRFAVDEALAPLLGDAWDLRAEVMYRYDHGDYREGSGDVHPAVVGRLHLMATNAE